MAAADRFRMEIHRAQEGRRDAPPGDDAVVIAAQVVTALQTVVSREVDPVEPAVPHRGGDRGRNGLQHHP